MQLRVSPCIGLVTPEIERAAEFYVNAMGMGLDEEQDSVELLAGPLHLFIDPGPIGQPVFELLVEDLDASEGKFKFFGFETLVWNGVGKANLVRDPFGLVFNVFEYGDDDYFEVAAGSDGSFCPHIGAVTPDTKAVAEFYSTVLQQPANKLSDGSILVSGGELGLRFMKGTVNVGVIWLAHSVSVPQLVRSGCESIEDGGRVIADPFGLCWAIEKRQAATHAVVHTL